MFFFIHSYDAFKAENFVSKTGLYFQREEEKAFFRSSLNIFE